MSSPKFRIFALGDSAITVEFGNSISPQLNDLAISVSDHLDANPFTGFIETVPAYSSIGIYYEPVETKKHHPQFPTAFEAVCEIAREVLSSIEGFERPISRRIEIGVDFGGEAAPDLEYVAERSGISPNDVISIFTSTEYRVYMLGFLPGFSYMGVVDDRIATPRKETPRSFVPRGSVGIAGSQTGIYSLDSPGGWQIIGRTEKDLFLPDQAEPCLLRPGDVITFVTVKR